MRYLIFLLLPILTFSQSKIEILGTTNVNKFTCVNEKPVVKDFYHQETNTYVPVSITLKVKDFQCNNAKMTKEFRSMLDMENHPEITISNQSIRNIKPKVYKAKSSLKIKGQSNLYNIVLFQNTNSWNTRKNLNLTDYNLQLPSLLGGLVYVKEKVTVDIHIQK